ncbi:MAG: hypothetical protein HYW90_05025 [Candidatus Sungbacteria bacterium]|nr:hypothetical protein [Candidatus Sungbacteria bacterium]
MKTLDNTALCMEQLKLIVLYHTKSNEEARMKKVGIGLVLLVWFFASGCTERPEPPSPAEQILKGEHKLRKMSERTNTDSSISGSFFFVVGGFNGSTTTQVLLKFAWEMNDGTYAISSLPLEKIRVKINEEAATPTIKFRWRRYEFRSTPQIQDLMDRYVVYALVTARESDWPVQIRLPLNDQ